MRNGSLSAALQSVYLMLVLTLLLIPLVALIPMSFSPSSTIVAFPERWSLRWFNEVLGSAEWHRAFAWSLLTAGVGSVIATTMGYFAAAFLVRTASRFRPVVQLLMLSPLMVPEVVVALATYVLSTVSGLHGSWVMIAVGQSLLGLPVATLIIAASLRGINDTVLRAAVSLGGRSGQVFLLVTAPMVLHAILSAVALTFLVAFDNLLIAVFLTTPGLQTLPVRIYQSVHYELTPAVAVVSVLLLAVLCLMLVAGELYRWSSRQRKRTAQSG
jgi:ABC-type spermidine/putrescine transport system permease subunit II